MIFGVGDVVRHPKWGTGIVVAVRHGGYDARVDFCGCAVWVSAVRLEFLEKLGSPGRRGGKIVPFKRIAVSPAQVGLNERKLIESFRLGVVPDSQIKEWTTGREKELSFLASWLSDVTQGSIIIEGRYGSGKTHLMRYLAQEALEKSFAVSFVRVDPGEENSSFPFRLYSNVMHNMAVPYDGAVSDITTIFREIVTKKSTTCLDEHVFFGPFIQALRQGDEWENDWQGFLGERVHSRFFPSTLDFTTVANVVCNLLSAISRFLVDDLKLAGLLVLVDEVETAEVRRYPYHWKRTLNFLRGLTLVANDDEILDENVSSTRFLVKTGEKTGLVYSGHYPDVRYYFTTPTFLKIALALTECRVFGMLRTWKESQPLVELGEVSQGALRELFSRVAGVYCALYKIKFPAHLEHWALYEMLYPAFYAGSIRGFMKALVELLDFVRHYPGRPLEDLQRIRSF